MNASNGSALHRLLTLQRLAARAEDEAARQLAGALARHGNAADRHSELLHYELEYTGSTPQVQGVQALTHHAGFVAKLRDAVRFQAERVGQFSAEVERARRHWIGLHREVEKLEQLAEIARQQLAAGERRRQSRELDELAQSGWLRQQVVG